MRGKAMAIFFILLATAAKPFAQVFSTENISLINGFRNALEGETLPYFSVYRQYAREALLTRCTNGQKTIAWETDIIPENTTGEYAYFTWIAAHSSGTSSGVRYFDLYINDAFALTFTTHPQQYPPYWSFAGTDSTRLQFEFKIRDGANDAHGMACLRVPLAKYKKGTALRLKVVGQNQQSNDWYMTFKYAFHEKAEVKPLPFLLKDGKRQLLQLTVLHFGPTDTLRLQVDEGAPQLLKVKHGFNSFAIPVPSVQQVTTVWVNAHITGRLQVREAVKLNPVTFRELNLVHHSHTDIGYSHIQETVIDIHNRNIREALRLIEKTKNYPDGSRFIWHIESAWVVENFLQIAGAEERKAFFTAVKNRQIVISANYANVMTGLCMPEEVDWISDYAVQLRNRHQLPVNTAMLTDVPGMHWSVVASLAKRGIRYFSNGINYIEGMPDNGDRIGSALTRHGDKPFWWKSPSGKDSILMWCAGKGYSSWHGTGTGAVFELGPEKIAGYLNQLDAEKYPYPLVQWRYNIVADNGPTDSTICDFVRQWNENYASPKLVLANVQDLFARFEKAYGKTIPVYSGDFTPYWEDGAYSTAREETDARLTAQKIITLEKLAGSHPAKPEAELLALAKKYTVLFHEHTWGAYNSISEPDIEFVKHQWNYKKSYLDSAMMYTRELENNINFRLRSKQAITIYNTLPFARSGYVEVKGLLPAAALAGEKGELIPLQHLQNGNTGFVAEQVPAGGYKRYTLANRKPLPAAAMAEGISLTINETNGAISQVNKFGKDWVYPFAFNGLMQAIYVNGLNPEKYDTARFTGMQITDRGPVVEKREIRYVLPDSGTAVYTVSRYRYLPYLEISVTVHKRPVRSKESLHFAFPFHLPAAVVRMGAGEGEFGPEYNQLAGANRDFYSVQRWLNLAYGQYNVTLCSPQAALFETGEMVNEEKNANGFKQWRPKGLQSSTIFLYALNNYWHTNFKADQEGPVTFRVYLQFEHKPFNRESASRFGYAQTQPLWVVMPE